MLLEGHVNLGLDPITSMWNVHLLYVVVCETAQVLQGVQVLNQIGQIVRDLRGLAVHNFQLLLVYLAHAYIYFSAKSYLTIECIVN